jgi:hypothetical protein
MLFCELYTDLGSHYFYTPGPGAPSKTQLTQVGRALKQLGVRHIGAHSPEARGRSERVFRTLQDRVPKELRLAGITTIEAANVWLKAYIAEHNARFAVKPQQEGTVLQVAWRGIVGRRGVPGWRRCCHTSWADRRLPPYGQHGPHPCQLTPTCDATPSEI